MPTSMSEELPLATAIRCHPLAELTESELVADDEPKLFRGVADGWRAASRWGSPSLLAEHYGHLEFEVAAGTHTRLADFLAETAQDGGRYLVETAFNGDKAVLLSDYTRPPGFADALDEIPGTISRPHWFVGGPRTGSKLHDDTRMTCGWSVCLFGPQPQQLRVMHRSAQTA